MLPPTSFQTSNIITTNVFLGKFLQLDKFISEKEKKHEKDSWFFNAFKMPSSRYGDFDKCHPIWSQFSFAMPQKSSNMFIPMLGGYQKQEKKRPQAVFSAILSIHNHSSQKNQSNKF
jgi:hypothetical protein